MSKVIDSLVKDAIDKVKTPEFQSAVAGPLLAYILDITGSLTAERAAEKVKEDILKEIVSGGMAISDSFSPGYCDWSVSGGDIVCILVG